MAFRRNTGKLGRWVSLADLQRDGRVYIADPWKIEPELQSIFASIYIGDPTLTGNNGNLSGSHVVVTTPSTANEEFAVKHGLAVTPKGCWQVLPGQKGGGLVRLRFSRAWDATYAYLKCPDVADEGVTVSLYFMGPS